MIKNREMLINLNNIYIFSSMLYIYWDVSGMCYVCDYH